MKWISDIWLCVLFDYILENKVNSSDYDSDEELKKTDWMAHSSVHKSSYNGNVFGRQSIENNANCKFEFVCVCARMYACDSNDILETNQF